MFHVDCVLMKLGDNDDSVQCDLLTNEITLDVLILTLNNMKNLRRSTALVLSKSCNGCNFLNFI